MLHAISFFLCFFYLFKVFMFVLRVRFYNKINKSIYGSPPTGWRPRRGGWAPAYAVVVENGKKLLAGCHNEGKSNSLKKNTARVWQLIAVLAALWTFVLCFLAVSSIDRYASIGGLSNQSDSMATQVGSAVGDSKLPASVTSGSRQTAVKRGSSATSGKTDPSTMARYRS